MTEEPERLAPGAAPPAGRPELTVVRCPRCDEALELTAEPLACSRCGRRYPRLGAIPVVLPDPEGYLASCRRQLELLGDRVERTVREIRQEMAAADVLPSARARCSAMIEALQGQLADVRAIVEPRLPPLAGDEARTGSRLVPTTLEYLPYLYRDWGWPSEDGGENERALAAVETALASHAPGRTLVLGAGACRLAYDLHRRHPGAELLVLDLDPLLFSVAHAVTHGETLAVREANLEVGERAQGSQAWTLEAPHGPVDDARFRFLVADAVDPPCVPGTFDTVLTPWFIDQGPEDVRDLLSTLHRMLRPGGRWVNLGPLRYDRELPVTRRFAREELAELAERAGFRMERWRSESGPYLVSKLNGRGKVEWVLSFSAVKLEESEASDAPEGGPPAWLLFRHLPIPTFPGQSVFWSEAPHVRLVVSSIDGTRTLDDIARLFADQAGQTDVGLAQIREAVRQCLLEVHPGCRPGE